MTRSRTGTAALVAAAALLAAACTDGDGEKTPAPAAAPDVMVEMFQWTWDAIGRECTDQLGPAGYAAVLTSPPQEHVLGPQWWTAYQPVSYRIESRLGTREQFAAMVRSCHDAGVRVVADAVLNHMTGQDVPGTGWAGSPYGHYDYPGTWTDADFHHCGLTPGDEITDYTDAAQVRVCELVNLADLATQTPEVRARLTAYLADLQDLGVDGFRIDAAKHLHPNDVRAILDGLDRPAEVVQEVIRGAGEPITPEQYVDNGDVFEFAWGRDAKGALAGSPELALQLGTGPGYLPSDRAVIFVDNHDTERNGSTLSYRDEDYVAANVLMLASTYGRPAVYSGYAFDEDDDGPPQDADGRVRDATCVADAGQTDDPAPGAWLCQHRWPQVAGMVRWRSVVGDAPVTDRWGDVDAVAFGRGDRGFVAINTGDDELTETLTTSLPDGDYCDVLTSGCAPTTVRDGRITVHVAPHGAQAWDVTARP